MGSRNVITISVRERFLWVEDNKRRGREEGYPLANIARVRTSAVKINLWRAFQHYLALVVGAVIFVVAAIAVLGAGFSITMAAASLGACVLISIALVVRLVRMSLQVLIVQTTGSPLALLVTPDRDKVLDLRDRITNAINNPNAEFQVTIENVQYGDSITQTGDHNTVNKE